MRTLAFAATLLVIGGSTAFGQTNKVTGINIGHPWAAPVSSMQRSGAVYMSLINSGDTPDQLISASSPVAQNIEFRVFDVEDGVYGMHQVKGIDLSPGAPATVLQPGGAQLVLEGLKQPLQAGKTFPLSLTFKEAGKIRVEVQIENRRMIMGESTLMNSLSSAALHGGLQ